MLYEQVGDVPNVVFPCAALVDGPTGRVTVYYGGADTVVCLAHGYVGEIAEWVKARSRLIRTRLPPGAQSIALPWCNRGRRKAASAC
jgi:hypothetical protein